jgi:hypothetical protein
MHQQYLGALGASKRRSKSFHRELSTGWKVSPSRNGAALPAASVGVRVPGFVCTALFGEGAFWVRVEGAARRDFFLAGAVLPRVPAFTAADFFCEELVERPKVADFGVTDFAAVGLEREARGFEVAEGFAVRGMDREASRDRSI